jgi:hypothetical protein
MSKYHLPEQFHALEPFAVEWGLETEQERREKRNLSSSYEEIKIFYDVMSENMDEILKYLSTSDINDKVAANVTLRSMALMYAEIAGCVELFGQIKVLETFDDQLRLTASHSDFRGVLLYGNEGSKAA